MMHPDNSVGSTERIIASIKCIIESESSIEAKNAGGGEGSVAIVMAGVDKAKALQWVCSELNVDQKSVISFGNEHNDVGMLKWAGWGVAVANASPAALEASSAVGRSNEEDGVAILLDDIVRGKQV